MTRGLARALLFVVGASAASSVSGMSGGDGIDLSVTKGPGASGVTLGWTGGLTPFAVFRSTDPTDVTTPLSFLGEASGTSWIDSPPPGVIFYYVQGSCDYDPPERCDGLDNDCDPETPDGSEDPEIGAGCDGADGDLCTEGTKICFAGALTCDDATGTSVETCSGNGEDEDCDGLHDEGFIVDLKPPCTEDGYIGTVVGDTGFDVLVVTGYQETWKTLRIRETLSTSAYLSATIALSSPAGSDFDLYVYCYGCGTDLASVSTKRTLEPHAEIVRVRRNDDSAFDDTFEVVIRIRSVNARVCAYWLLTIQGHVTVQFPNCS